MTRSILNRIELKEIQVGKAGKWKERRNRGREEEVGTGTGRELMETLDWKPLVIGQGMQNLFGIPDVESEALRYRLDEPFNFIKIFFDIPLSFQKPLRVVMEQHVK